MVYENCNDVYLYALIKILVKVLHILKYWLFSLLALPLGIFLYSDHDYYILLTGMGDALEKITCGYSLMLYLYTDFGSLPNLSWLYNSDNIGVELYVTNLTYM